MPDEEFDWSLGGSVAPDETTRSMSSAVEVPTQNGLDIQALAPSGQEVDQGDDQGAGTEQRARNEKGQFVAAAAVEEVADDDEGAAEGDEQAAGDDQALILGKFRSREELERSYLELENRLGSQGDEVGTLRNEVRQMRDALQQTPQQPVTEALIEQVEAVAEENPAGAAIWALENQPMLYDRVMETWYENDPRRAAAFERQLEMAQLRQEMDTKLAPVAQPIAQQQQQASFNEAWAATAQKYPDMKEIATAMSETAQYAPEIVAALQSGETPVAEKQRLVENLYWLTKGRQADTTAAAAVDLGRQQATTAAAEKAAAAVVTGTAPPANAGTADPIRAWKEAMIAEPSTSIFGGISTS